MNALVDIDEQIARLESTGDHKVLRRLDVREGHTRVDGDLNATQVAIVVDTETTGLSPDADVIIEIAMRRCRYDAAGRILEIGRAATWREDPGCALAPEIVRLTGISDADLVGQEIDTAAATSMLKSADVIIAHNACFDRKFVERRLPEAAGFAWACSCREIDWAAGGYDGRSLGWLLAQAGWFHGAHRAEADVDAVIQLLQQTMPHGRTALRELLDTAGSPSVLVRAMGTHFDVKDALKARGYHWQASLSVWCREVAQDDQYDEEYWLARNAYQPQHRPRASGPEMIPVTWFERHL